MSPAAAGSDPVELEILEGLRLGRPFLPILLAGERLFLLGATHYFDATDGRLPGDEQKRDLKSLFEFKEEDRQASAAPVRTAAEERRSPLPVVIKLPPVRVSLAKLRHYLTEGQLESADIITTSMLLGAVGRLSVGWLRPDDAAKIPADLLDQIDDAWWELTGGDYGFKVQLLLRRHSPAGLPVGSQRDFTDLATALGWTNGERRPIPRYREFAGSPDHPTGFFPTIRHPETEHLDGWRDRWIRSATAVHSRLKEWGK